MLNAKRRQIQVEAKYLLVQNLLTKRQAAVESQRKKEVRAVHVGLTVKFGHHKYPVRPPY